ncbi:hypothetical protein BKA70DRAFT_1479658 [Coprinopsis sp. MPI-PUGE-AT-0042]|nr:hypothetical protein BKA70DRAFT_1479658 [Coprinopsis sp. MPI-PUGE-AT-0042]
MSLTMDMDPRILPYTTNNDPLPSKLKPIRDAYLEEAKTRVTTCDACINQLEAQIQGRKREVQVLEKEVETLQMELQQQRDRRNGHDTTIQILASATSVVRKLPPEIVAEIIKFSVATDWMDFCGQHLRELCTVSQLWRRTAMSTPSLWRSLSVDLKTLSTGRTREQARLLLARALNTWFARSGEGAEIDLTVYGDLNTKRSRRLQAADLIDWMRTSGINFVSVDLHEVFNSIPELKALFRTSAEDFLPVVFIHPRLTTLHLLSVTVCTSDIREVLQGLPSLQSLSLGVRVDIDDEDTRPFTHHSLCELSLCEVISGQLFKAISCPALECLELSPGSGRSFAYDENVENRSAQALGDLIQRSSLPSITLDLGAQYPPGFLNVLLSVSSPKIGTLKVNSPFCLPLDINKDDTQLIIPRSIQNIDCFLPTLKDSEDPVSWMSTLAQRLEAPSERTLRVKIGFGHDAIVRDINGGVIS